MAIIDGVESEVGYGQGQQGTTRGGGGRPCWAVGLENAEPGLVVFVFKGSLERKMTIFVYKRGCEDAS